MIRAKPFPLLALLALLASLSIMAMTWSATGSAQTRNLSGLGRVPATTSCAALVSIDLEKAVGASTRILSATSVSTRSGPVCVVKGNIAPHIGFEARLPEHGWTQRY